MTWPVITVAPDTDLRQVVESLLKHRISGVLVVEEGRVVGTVGDGDLLHRHEIGTDEWRGYRTWWQRLMQPEAAPTAYVRSHGGRARDVMTDNIVSVGDDTPLTRVASIFEKRRIRRVPVLRNGKLVGVITRADLLRALAASAVARPSRPIRADDETIRAQLLDELGRQAWWTGGWSNVFVNHGVVRFVGVVQHEADKAAARIAAENIPGVLAVDDRRVRYGDWQPMF